MRLVSQLDFSRYPLGEHVVAPYRLRKTVPSKHLITNQSGLAVWFAFGSKEQVWFGGVVCLWKQRTCMVWGCGLPLEANNMYGLGVWFAFGSKEHVLFGSVVCLWKQRTGKCLYEN